MLRARATDTHYSSLQVQASQGPGPGLGTPRPKRAPPGVDTRVHWDNEDEGWIGGTNTDKQQSTAEEKNPKNLLGEKFADLLSASSGSHYE